MTTFREDLRDLINKHNMESGSCTPDFILAEYLWDCLGAFDKAADARRAWYDDAPDLEGPDKPTIHEVEAILDDPNVTVKINPDGSVSKRPLQSPDET